jgi:hypothetical protein
MSYLNKIIYLSETINLLGQYNDLNKDNNIINLPENNTNISGITNSSRLIELVKYYDYISDDIPGIVSYIDDIVIYNIDNIQFKESVSNYNGTVYSYNSSYPNILENNDIVFDNDYYLENNSINDEIVVERNEFSVFKNIQTLSLINSLDDIEVYF